MGNYDTETPMKSSKTSNLLSYYQMYKLWNNSQFHTNKYMLYVFLISIEYFLV